MRMMARIEWEALEGKVAEMAAAQSAVQVQMDKLGKELGEAVCVYTAVVGGCSKDNWIDEQEVESILSSGLWKLRDN